MQRNAQLANVLKRLTNIGLALSAEKDFDKLLEIILVEAQSITNADGASLYVVKDDHLEFSVARNISLAKNMGRTSNPFRPMPLYDKDGKPDYSSQAIFSVLKGQSINITDIYNDSSFSFAGAKKFDTENNYRTKSMLTVPLLSRKDRAIGCLQLINAMSPGTKDIIPFSAEMQDIVQSIAAQAAIILENKEYGESQRNLLEAFIKVIAEAIDKKSPYTGNHCTRVPELTEMIAEAACLAKEGKFKDFLLNEGEKYELHIAGWLHDCGKVVTPVHIMDKSTKLETIWDRIELVKTRFEVLKRDAEIKYLNKLQATPSDKPKLEKEFKDEVAQLAEDLAFLVTGNTGGEFLADDKIARLQKIAGRTWSYQNKDEPVLSDNELYNLSIRRGTLTAEERKIMEGHMVATVDMLNTLPFPEHLRRVPEYACGHHERMDGKGYPKGIKAGTMSLPARMMAIADVFEALTADDRPYKPAKKLSETMKIIGNMKRDNHLDPDLVDFFITSKVYIDFAKKYLASKLIDKVDEQEILDIKPKAAV